MVKRFFVSRRTGFYLAVTREGEVGAGDEMTVIGRDPNAVPVSEIVRLYAEKRYSNADVTWVKSLPLGALRKRGTLTKGLKGGALVDEVLRFFGARIEDSQADLLAKQEIEKRRSTIIEALLAKAHALADAHLAASSEAIPKIFRKGLHYSAGRAEAHSLKEETNTEPDKPKAEGEEMEKKPSLGDFQVVEGTPEGEPAEQQFSTEELQEKLEELNASSQQESQSEDTDSTARVSLKELEAAYTDLTRWIDPNDPRALLLTAKHAVAHTHYGIALRSLQKLLDDKGPSKSLLPISTAVVELTDQLGWVHVGNALRNEMIVKYRPSFRLF